VNIIPLNVADFVDADSCDLHDARAVHIVTTLKSQIGDALRVGLINGKLGTAIISAINIKPANVSLRVTLTEAPPAPLAITLLLALPRPKMLGRLLRDVTSLGVKNIHLFHSEKVEKSYWQTPTLAPTYVEKQLIEGLAQARDTSMPSVHSHKRFADILTTILPQLLATHRGVIADPFSPTATAITSTEKPLLLVIGPEGGFTENERQQFLASGCEPLWLGSRILRVETAVHVAIGRLSHALP
jgi:16S rRNA (uracil1498-N3)-methyltransferase